MRSSSLSYPRLETRQRPLKCQNIPSRKSDTSIYTVVWGRRWQKCTLYTAFLYPGICFGVFLVFDGMLYNYGSTGAIPLASLLSLLALWFGVSVPLVFLGAYFGSRRRLFSRCVPREGSKVPAESRGAPRKLASLERARVGDVFSRAGTSKSR